MKYQRLFSSCLLLLSFFISLLKCDLRFVFEMFRHGARAPWSDLDVNSKDVLGEPWIGSGELSDVGMRQHYLLGYRNRLRYDNFLSKSYDPKEIYVISTDVNRTIMSAYSQLQGLYSPGTGPSLTPAQESAGVPPINDTDYSLEQGRLGNFSLPNQMQVLPIHLFDLKARRAELHDSNNCAGVAKYIEENKKKQIFKDFYAKFNSTYGEGFKIILNITDDAYFFNYFNVYQICDAFVADYVDGRELSNMKLVGIDLEAFSKDAFLFLKYDILYAGFGDKELYIAKMSMSPTAFDIVNWMDVRISNDIKGKGFLGYNTPKMVMYSAHDTDMAAIQTYIKAIFNRTELYYTPFASQIFIELYRKDNVTDFKKATSEDYFVSITYNGINLFNATFNEFNNEITQKSIKDDEISQFCGFTNFSTVDNSLLISTCVLGVLSIGLIIYIIGACLKNKREPNITAGYRDIM